MPRNEAMPIRADLASHGFTLERTVIRLSNPRNGNMHNPTPRYEWILKRHGRIVDSASTRRAVLASLEVE